MISDDIRRKYRKGTETEKGGRTWFSMQVYSGGTDQQLVTLSLADRQRGASLAVEASHFLNKNLLLQVHFHFPSCSLTFSTTKKPLSPFQTDCTNLAQDVAAYSEEHC